MSGGGNREAVKVVIINTEYVETDAMSFKSVVQRLTGKDSTVEVEAPPPSSDKQMRRVQAGVGMSGATNSVLARGLSSKELDRLLMELPPLDELYRRFME